jgi:hypothetical protein
MTSTAAPCSTRRGTSSTCSEPWTGARRSPRGRCCQHCCQAAGQYLIPADRPGISTQHMATTGRSWTVRPFLRILDGPPIPTDQMVAVPHCMLDEAVNPGGIPGYGTNSWLRCTREQDCGWGTAVTSSAG